MALRREKPLHWIGSAKRDLVGFPEKVMRSFGYALGLVQQGRTPESAKAWKGEGPGVFDLREDGQGGTYRVVYVVRFEKAIYVLHCFQKKSPRGIETAKTDVDLVSSRLKLAKEDYEARYGEKA